jgi:hypothetical protein
MTGWLAQRRWTCGSPHLSVGVARNLHSALVTRKDHGLWAHVLCGGGARRAPGRAVGAHAVAAGTDIDGRALAGRSSHRCDMCILRLQYTLMASFSSGILEGSRMATISGLNLRTCERREGTGSLAGASEEP